MAGFLADCSLSTNQKGSEILRNPVSFMGSPQLDLPQASRKHSPRIGLPHSVLPSLCKGAVLGSRKVALNPFFSNQRQRNASHAAS